LDQISSQLRRVREGGGREDLKGEEGGGRRG
jgi:hypothetical protein